MLLHSLEGCFHDDLDVFHAIGTIVAFPEDISCSTSGRWIACYTSESIDLLNVHLGLVSFDSSRYKFTSLLSSTNFSTEQTLSSCNLKSLVNLSDTGNRHGNSTFDNCRMVDVRPLEVAKIRFVLVRDSRFGGSAAKQFL